MMDDSKPTSKLRDRKTPTNVLIERLRQMYSRANFKRARVYALSIIATRPLSSSESHSVMYIYTRTCCALGRLDEALLGFSKTLAADPLVWANVILFSDLWSSGISDKFLELYFSLTARKSSDWLLVDCAEIKEGVVTPTLNPAGSQDHLSGTPPYLASIGKLDLRNRVPRVYLIDKGTYFRNRKFDLVYTDNRLWREASSRIITCLKDDDIAAAVGLNDVRPFDYPGLIGILCDQYECNYAHWLLDWIPRIPAYAAANLSIDAFASCDLAGPFQKQFIDIFVKHKFDIINLDEVRAVSAQGIAVADSVHRDCHPCYSCSSWAMEFLNSTLCEHISVDGQKRKIYISRQKSPRRRIINSSEIEALLSSHGFEEVFLEELSIVEQARTFMEASHVFGLHGAGMANIVFSRPETKFMEVFHSVFGNPAFAHLAYARGLAYTSSLSIDGGSKLVPRDVFGSVDYNVDVNHVRHWLEAS